MTARLAAALIMLAVCKTVWPASAEEAFARAVAALKARDLSVARTAIQECLNLRADYPGANAVAAEIESDIGLDLAANGRFAEAAEHFRAVVQYQPRFAGGHYNLGLALLNLGDAPAAEKSFRETLKLDPAHAKARAQLANALLAQARSDRTRRQETAQAFRHALQLSPGNADLHFNLAYTLGLLGDDSGALAEYRATSRLEAHYPHLEASMGYTLYRLSEWSEAEKHFRAALAEGQDDYALHFYLGLALIKAGKPVDARMHLERAARLDPDQPGVHFQLAALARSSGDTQQAAAENDLFRRLSAKQESDLRAKALEAVARRALDRGDLAQGINALEQRFENRPDAETARNLALAHLQNANVERARALLRKALEMAPKDADAYNYLGLLEAREGNFEAAEKDFTMAASLNSSQMEPIYNAGLAALHCNRPQDAIRYFEHGLRRSEDPRLHEALALALSEAGRYEEAQKHFDAARRAPQSQ